jgi:hypothetical protein
LDINEVIIDTDVFALDFYVAARKDPRIKKILSTLAREPDGCSRIPRESFQEVFDRMEKELNVKSLDWPLIVEYFTKRGKPLTQKETELLLEED